MEKSSNLLKEMKENGPSPSSPPEYSEPSDGYPSKSDLANSPPVIVVTEEEETNAPPAYDAIFKPKVSKAPKKKNKSNIYIQDDRNIWEKFHECFEMSVLQQMVWLTALAFAISYITFGLIFKGDCTWQRLGSDGKTEEEHDLTTFIQAEGGVLCATIIYVLFFRFLSFLENRKPKHKSKSNIQEKQKCMAHVFLIGSALYIVNFALCIAGAARVIPAYTRKNDDLYKLKCNQDFFSFYFYAKIVQLSVLMPYAVYVLISLFVMPMHQKRWLFRRKWRQWFRLLDADQDGVISADDMEKTNAKLEQIRKIFGVRGSALGAAKQKKWWNDHIFKLGPGKDISVNDYIHYLEGTVGGVAPTERAKKVKPTINGFFDFFSTGDYRKKSLIIGEKDFVKFWSILAGVDETQCKKLFFKYFPAPFTMAYFLEDFVNFLSNDEFLDEISYRVFNVLRYQETRCRCCEV